MVGVTPSSTTSTSPDMVGHPELTTLKRNNSFDCGAIRPDIEKNHEGIDRGSVMVRRGKPGMVYICRTVALRQFSHLPYWV
jgi:hypothetical protein